MHFQGGIIMKIKRWIAFGIGTLLIIMLLWIYGSFNGLITSKLWVKHCANGYIQEHYKEYDFQLNEVNYNFKDGLYNAKIVSPTSEDSTFHLLMIGRANSFGILMKRMLLKNGILCNE